MEHQLAVFVLFNCKALGIARQLAVEFFDHVVDGHLDRREGVDIELRCAVALGNRDAKEQVLGAKPHRLVGTCLHLPGQDECRVVARVEVHAGWQNGKLQRPLHSFFALAVNESLIGALVSSIGHQTPVLGLGRGMQDLLSGGESDFLRQIVVLRRNAGSQVQADAHHMANR